MENSTIVVDLRPFYKICRVDEYLGSELDASKHTLCGYTINFKDDIVPSNLIGVIDIELAVVVGEITICLDDFFFYPFKEARFTAEGLSFKGDSEFFAI
jgi:hypothetical protein